MSADKRQLEQYYAFLAGHIDEVRRKPFTISLSDFRSSHIAIRSMIIHPLFVS